LYDAARRQKAGRENRYVERFRRISQRRTNASRGDEFDQRIKKNMKKILALLLVLSFSFAVFGQANYTKNFDAAQMKERVRRLSADEFAGRSPSDRRAADYIAAELKKSGAKPVNGSYFQNVKLFGTKTNPQTKLSVGGAAYNFGDDWVGFPDAQKPEVAVDAEIVFMGYGIDAPLYKWNDYKGNAADYRGKVLVILVNDPPATASEPNLFGGKGLTYFGRWTYKLEEAARKGAAGVILVHTTESAGYGWNVVRSSNGGWRYEIARGTNSKIEGKSQISRFSAGRNRSEGERQSAKRNESVRFAECRRHCRRR
jgi:hypothetical protein